jgi:hypothetical protein
MAQGKGDACTRFFHLKANGRSRKNYTMDTQDFVGYMIEDPGES